MKYFFIFIVTLFYFGVSKAQSSGEIVYNTFLLDTIKGTVDPVDSLQNRFVFNNDESFWETKLGDVIVNRTIIKPNEVINMNNIGGNTNVQSRNNDTIPSDSLILNYIDTNYIYVRNGQTKYILGHNCKNVVVIKKSNPETQVQIWFDDTIPCNNLISGGGSTTHNTKGIIFEISTITSVGKNKMIAVSVNFGTINQSEFNPSPSN